MDDKYLQLRNKLWFLNFRLPKRWGGDRIRRTLGTGDIKQARLIRDRFIFPILQADTLLALLEEFAQKAHELKTETNEHIINLKNVISNEGDIGLQEAISKFTEYLRKSTLRASSKKDYISAILTMSKHLNNESGINMLCKKDATTARNEMQNDISATRITFCFQTFRKFLRWCEEEGYARKTLSDNFVIPLPTPDKQHAPDIPVPLAELAMNCVPEFTLAPRIARYTGMRLNEVLKLKTEHIVQSHGIYCFSLAGEMVKTKSPRLIPIAEKLKPYVIDKSLNELRRLGHKNDKYNKNIKKIKGLEKCKFHSWRTYANTRMMEAGVDRAIRMKILGHKGDKSDIHTGYTSVQLSELKKAVDLIH